MPAREVTPFIGDGTVEELDAETSRITVGSWSWAGVLAAVARFDAPFEVVGPQELRVAAGVLAGRFADAAGGSSS
ncbi:hypothetical protein [Microbacterium sp. PMB16]|uniref:hypothetical protein n=1 Tax=Microbacterium sp. PMB16 TaxID=3120157 RepID=UPI003F4C5AD9